MPSPLKHLLVLAVCCCKLSGAPFHFIHLTDPHLFGAKDRAEENARAFKWCIEEINDRVAAGTQFSFVAVTGGLALEDLPHPGTNAVADIVTPAAQSFGKMIADSKVPLWFFVPGDEDIENEHPATKSRYHAFIRALQQETSGITIIDLSPRLDLPGSGRHDFIFGTNRWRIVGFDNALFASSVSFTNVKKFASHQLAKIAQVRASLVAEPPYDHALIFYHVPEVENPKYVFPLLNQAELTNPELKSDYLRKEHPISAWAGTERVHDDWNALITNRLVRGLFAGHFQSPVRSVYESFSWLREPSESSESISKLFIAPPAGLKTLVTGRPAARGYREISFDAESGMLLAASIRWYPGISDGTEQERSSPRGWESLLKALAVATFVLIVVAALLLAPKKVHEQLVAFFKSFRPEVVMNMTFVTFFILGFIAIGIFAQNLQHFGAGCLWALGAVAVGAFFGLLFGIHRTGSNSGSGDRPEDYRPEINNNLIEVSDWLTKIIVGLGLIELRNVDEHLLQIATPLALCLGDDCGLAVAAGILIAFTFGGFLAGFLNSRTFLTEILRRYDELLYRKLGSKVGEKLGALEDAPLVIEGTGKEFDPLAKEAADHILRTPLNRLSHWHDVRLWAKAALSKDRIADAIAAYDQALALVPGDAETRLGYAAALHKNGSNIGVILRQLESARDSLMRSSPPDLRKNVYKSLTYAYLYLKQPDSFDKALGAAREYFAGEKAITSGGLWVNIACAYGQAYAWIQLEQRTRIEPPLNLQVQPDQAKQPMEKPELLEWVRDQAFYALRQVVQRDKKWVLRLRQLMGLDPRPAGEEEDDDLEVFKNREEFTKLLAIEQPSKTVKPHQQTPPPTS